MKNMLFAVVIAAAGIILHAPEVFARTFQIAFMQGGSHIPSPEVSAVILSVIEGNGGAASQTLTTEQYQFSTAANGVSSLVINDQLLVDAQSVLVSIVGFCPGLTIAKGLSGWPGGILLSPETPSPPGCSPATQTIEIPRSKIPDGGIEMPPVSMFPPNGPGMPQQIDAVELNAAIEALLLQTGGTVPPCAGVCNPATKHCIVTSANSTTDDSGYLGKEILPHTLAYGPRLKLTAKKQMPVNYLNGAPLPPGATENLRLTLTCDCKNDGDLVPMPDYPN